jgi:hypothetical protein
MIVYNNILVWSYELKTLPSLKEGYSPGMFQDTFPTTERFLQVILYICPCFPPTINSNSGAMVSVFALSVWGRGFKTRWGQTKDYEIGISCFSVNHAALRRKSKDWLVRNQDNVFEWGDMSIRWLLFQYVS